MRSVSRTHERYWYVETLAFASPQDPRDNRPLATTKYSLRGPVWCWQSMNIAYRNIKKRMNTERKLRKSNKKKRGMLWFAVWWGNGRWHLVQMKNVARFDACGKELPVQIRWYLCIVASCSVSMAEQLRRHEYHKSEMQERIRQCEVRSQEEVTWNHLSWEVPKKTEIIFAKSLWYFHS